MKKNRDIRGILADTGVSEDAIQKMPVNEFVCLIRAAKLQTFTRQLKEKGVWHLTAITAVEEEAALVLLYHYWLNGGLTVRVPVPQEGMRIPSITGLIPGAAFYEREIQELFGVHFDGLSRQEMLFIAEDWQDDPPMQPKPGSDEKKSDLGKNKEP